MNIPLNEDFLKERDIRFEALQQLREIQAGLVGVSFLPVLGIMRPDNEYRKDIIKFQDDLDKVVLNVQNFISKVKNDVNYSDEEGSTDTGDVDDVDNENDDKELKKDKPKNEVEDSSEPKE